MNFFMCQIQAGVQRVRANFASQVKKGKLTEDKLEGLMKKLHGTVTYDNFKSVDMVRAPPNGHSQIKLEITHQHDNILPMAISRMA